ncbi:Na+/H+ antiporter [Modestobacter sp. I12A-02628]|uniref:Na+/H+ antiporter n=1 Tax=Goekera deserti TaxID=2497753 RepID=A0A7K3WIF5_9ACTN|nr:Na+/H+ antiporter [Goekera deserti]MPQ96699.1 Na+/H+ antiporter [Goekera deserti]NDI46987.1 Na+/H+ antiporter [Goekera deserti]NEL56224.1 Na+/H+ antiporter [Goekera deserti]
MTGPEVLALVVGAVTVAALARRLGRQAPLLLVLVGFAVSFLPGVPQLEIDGELLLAVVLPPLLYSAALGVSYRGFRALIAPIVQLGVVLVVVTAVVVALVAHWVVPGLPLPAALVLGAVVAPPDAVSAAAIGRRLGLPRPVMTVLSGESLINDAASLTFYKVALVAAVGAGTGGGLGVDWTDAGRTFALAVVAGVATGLAVGVLVHAVRLRLDDPVVESVVGLLVPFAAYLLAEELSGSGVLAVVAAGLYLGHRSPEAGYASRLQERPLWASLDLLLEAVVFALIGLQLRQVAEALQASERSNASLIGAALAVLATAVVVRPLFVFGMQALRRGPWPRRRGSRPPRASWQQQAVLSWTGMRGVVTLAAAAAVPASFPERDVLQLLAYTVTIGTLLLQGLTLPWVIDRLDVRDPGQAARDAEAEAHVAERATAAALIRIAELEAELAERVGAERAAEVAGRIRAPLQARSRMLTQAVRAEEDEAARSRGRAQVFRRARQEVLQAQRRVLKEERDKGHVSDEVMRAVLQELDYEEAATASSWVGRL